MKDFKPITKQLFIFGIPVLVTNVGGKVIGYIDTLILTNFRTLTEVGIYNVILPSAMLFLYFGISVSAVAFPLVSELWAKKDKTRLSDGLKLIHKYAFVGTIPLVFTVFAFSSLFINFFFGKQYTQGALALQILLIGILFYIVAGINNNIIAGIGKPKAVTKIILFAAAINLIANLILIPFFGIEGAAFATTLSYFVALVLSTKKVTEYLEVDFPKAIWVKIVFSGIIFAVIISYLKDVLVMNPWIELIISASAAFLIYLIIIFLLDIINIDEIIKYIKLAR
jgi:O-antigen/teichoic acid export membrane protein